MSTETGSEDPKLEQAWTPDVPENDASTAEIPNELTLDAEHHTPEEAGYGYGV